MNIYNICEIPSEYIQDLQHFQRASVAVASVQSPNPQHRHSPSTSIYGLYLYRPNVNTYIYLAYDIYIYFVV